MEISENNYITSKEFSKYATSLFRALNQTHINNQIVDWFSVNLSSHLEPDIIKNNSKDIFIDETNVNLPNNINYIGFEAHEIRSYQNQATDYFILGLHLLSWCTKIDFSSDEWSKKISEIRRFPHLYNPVLHPKLLQLVYNLTALKPENRLTDFDLVMHVLFHYEEDDSIPIWNQLSERDAIQILKNRLFDFSKRNKSLYFSPNRKFINLTLMSWASHHALIAKNESFEKLCQQKYINLNSYIDFNQFPNIATDLNNLRLENQRNINDYGINTLNFMPLMLNWVHYKEDSALPIQTPILFWSCSLEKSKRIKSDHFTLKLDDADIIVNPTLQYIFQIDFNINLPSKIAPTFEAIQEFISLLKSEIVAQGQGISIKIIDQPRVSIFNKQSNNDHTAHNLALEHILTLNNEKEIQTLSNEIDFAFQWEIDLTHINIGIVNSKKLSLVSDYEQMASEPDVKQTWETIINHTSSQVHSMPLNISSWHNVISADPTQHDAINYANAQQSYVIQGPPGTGKSQTITNLIATYIAQGKSVLFVCEKRAALDVVYHRLKQVELDTYCTYIHDSQLDKKDFILSLKATHQLLTDRQLDFSAVVQQRDALVAQLEQIKERLQLYHNVNKNSLAYIGTNTYNFLSRFSEILPHKAKLSPAQQELVPTYNTYLAAKEPLEAIIKDIEQLQSPNYLCESPFLLLNTQVLKEQHPLNWIIQSAEKIEQIIGIWNLLVEKYSLNEWKSADLNAILQIQDVAHILKEWADLNLVSLINPKSKLAKTFDKDAKTLDQLKKTIQQLDKQNIYWKERPDEDTLVILKGDVEKYEPRFFKFFYSSWRKTKKYLETNYDFSAHNLKPSYHKILTDLEQYYQQQKAAQDLHEKLASQYQLTDINEALRVVKKLRLKQYDPIFQSVIMHDLADKLVLEIVAYHEILDQLTFTMKQLFNNLHNTSLTQIAQNIKTITADLESLQRFIPLLLQIHLLPDDFKQMILVLPIKGREIEATIAAKTFDKLLKRHPIYAAYQQEDVVADVKLFQRLYDQLLGANIAYIHAYYASNYKKINSLLDASAATLEDEEKQLKKELAVGRKILDNEFGKKMRFKSIRSLVSAESNHIIKALKPVWLMSPLSVSDVFPLQTDLFDVVIFDEASQIPLEDSVPAICRGAQTIIVGDEQQMPPTNFFAIKQEEEEVADEADYLIQAESLLELAAKKLPHIMLQWHYRSKFESLISYSNYNFYAGNLVTVPDPYATISQLPLKQEYAQLSPDLKYILQQSISFHYLNDAVYKNRKNIDEARYIANMVYEMLMQNIQETIGIVAFSKEQQSAIEAALEEKARENLAFETILEKAYQRTENDQFVGLIVKNLENIQGDERDIIIMSVCYGYDEHRRMLMNFGPINRHGGEKRLNVLFSRAKQHMVVVSSIKHPDITNVHNTGANILKRFLAYAEAISNHEPQQAMQILQQSNNNQNSFEVHHQPFYVVLQIGEWLKNKGYDISYLHGQSKFKCSIAVRKSAATPFYLAIIVDDQWYYENENALDVGYNRTLLLERSGWKVIRVYIKDWIQDADKVLNNLQYNL